MPKKPQIVPLEEGEVRPIPQPELVVSKMDSGIQPTDPPAEPSELFKRMNQHLKEASGPIPQDKPVPKPPEKPQDKPEAPEPVKDTKAPEKPQEEAVAAAETDVPSVIKSPKAADEFRKLKSILSSQIKAKQDEILGLKKALDEEKTKVAKTTVAPSDLEKQMEVLKQERDQLLTEIESVALERSPAFKRKYETRFKSAMEQAKSAAGEQLPKVEAIMAMPPSPQRKSLLNEVLDELDTADQLTLVTAVHAYDSAKQERETELGSPKLSLQQIEEQTLLEKQKTEQILKAKQDFVLGEVLKAAQSFEAFQRNDKDEEHNKLVDEYEKDVALFIRGQVNDAAAAFLPVLAAEGQYLKQNRIPQLEQKIKELEATITKLGGAGASVKDGSSSKADQAKEGRSEVKKGFVEAFREAYSGPPINF